MTSFRDSKFLTLFQSNLQISLCQKFIVSCFNSYLEFEEKSQYYFSNVTHIYSSPSCHRKQNVPHNKTLNTIHIPYLQIFFFVPFYDNQFNKKRLARIKEAMHLDRLDEQQTDE